MARCEAWIWDQGPESGRAWDALEQRLEAAGVALALRREEDSAPGIVVCHRVDDALRERIEGWSRGGFHRLMLVVRERAALGSEAVWSLLQAGASEVLAWDDLDDLAGVVASRIRRWGEIDDILESAAVRDRLVGRSPAWTTALRQVVEFALYTASPILITGQSGTGKELVAHLVHEVGSRKCTGEFVLLDCATVVTDLSGSEFFGHERGAFTGAHAVRDGVFARADGGTLFLDEVGELPPRLQAELLRVVQEGSYKRVGSNEWKRTSFRLVCATHRDLEADRARGEFREDLYHRLAGGICRLPPLDGRREDIPLLVDAFLHEIFGADAPALDGPVKDFLVARSYPGNVRELRQLVARMACRHVPPGPLTVGSIPESERSVGSFRCHSDEDSLDPAVRILLARGRGVEEIRQAAAALAYRIVLNEEGGDTTLSARRLKVSARAVQMYLRNRTVNGTAATRGPG